MKMLQKRFLILTILLIQNIISKKKEIFEETKVKNVKIKNRLIRGSVGDYCFFRDGHITNEAYDFYDKLSDEGVGIVFVGYTTISDYDQYDDTNIFRLDKDEYIEDFKKLASVIHKNDRTAILQLVHIGGQSSTQKTDKLLAPSKVVNPMTKRTTYEMSKEDILRIEDDFVKASVRAKKAGFDGVEIHGAHFYLVSEFLSPLFNKRTDEYGGNDENRARFLVEIIQKVRKAVGNDFIISVKINSEENDPNGITEEGFILASKLAEKAGADMIQVSGMKWMNEKIKPKTPVYFKQTAKLAEIVKVPVVLVGGLRDVDTMEDAINNSNIQYLSIARPLICEPDIVKTWKHGDKKKSNCLNCNNCLKKGFCVLKDKEQLKK